MSYGPQLDLQRIYAPFAIQNSALHALFAIPYRDSRRRGMSHRTLIYCRSRYHCSQLTSMHAITVHLIVGTGNGQFFDH